MALIGRRRMLAAGATLMAGGGARKCGAETPDFRAFSAITAVPPTALPALSFTTLAGGQVTLASFRGKPVVLNFWATWCIPCVAELPELDRLAATGAFTVLAVSADRGGAARVKPFLAQHKLAHATVLLDASTDAAHAVDVAGFPTTLIIDAAGQLRGRLEGPTAWGEAGGVISRLVN